MATIPGICPIKVSLTSSVDHTGKGSSSTAVIGATPTPVTSPPSIRLDVGAPDFTTNCTSKPIGEDFAKARTGIPSTGRTRYSDGLGVIIPSTVTFVRTFSP